MTALTDWRGKTIAPGATILYTQRNSTVVTVIEATVLEITQFGSLYVQATASSGYGHAKGPSTLTALKNVTVLEEA